MPERRAAKALVDFLDSLTTIREEIETTGLIDRSPRWKSIHNIASLVSAAISQNHAYGMAEHMKKFDPSEYPDDGALARVDPIQN